MLRCTTCGGWTPAHSSCPNCHLGGAPAPRGWLKSVGLAVGGAAVGMTLAACYGSPCARYGADGECLPPPTPTKITDYDGLCADMHAEENPDLATDPNCAAWLHCQGLKEAQDPNLATDPNCQPSQDPNP